MNSYPPPRQFQEFSLDRNRRYGWNQKIGPSEELRDTIWLATWNIRRGSLDELSDVLKAQDVDIAAIQEIQWKGSDSYKTNDYTFYCCGNPRSSFGTAFAVKNSLAGVVVHFGDVNERICTLRTKCVNTITTYICVHAPAEEADSGVKADFYDLLGSVYDDAPPSDVRVVLGDFNARVGKESIYVPTIGKSSLHELTNDNGSRLVHFASNRNMQVVSTRFPHKEPEKVTWTSPDGWFRDQIDHVIVDMSNAYDILDVRSVPEASIGSDHYLLKIKYRQVLPNKEIEDGPRRNKRRRKYEPKQQSWYDEECEEALAERNEARRRMIQRGSTQNVEAFITARRKANHVIRRKKRMWERKMAEAENKGISGGKEKAPTVKDDDDDIPSNDGDDDEVIPKDQKESSDSTNIPLPQDESDQPTP